MADQTEIAVVERAIERELKITTYFGDAGATAYAYIGGTENAAAGAVALSGLRAVNT